MQLLIPTHTFDYVLPNLAIGTEFDREEIPLLKTHGFTSALDLRMESIGDTPTLLEYGIEYHRIPAPDALGFSIEQFKEGTQWIENRLNGGAKIYCHCKQGLGRAPTMVIAYLAKNGMPLKEAYKKVRQKRPIILITYGQIQSLKKFIKNLSNFPQRK